MLLQIPKHEKLRRAKKVLEFKNKINMKFKNNKLVNYAVYSGIILIGGVVLYLMFAPKIEIEQTDTRGLNLELPEAEKKELHENKSDAYEAVQAEQNFRNQLRTLEMDGDLDLSKPTKVETEVPIVPSRNSRNSENDKALEDWNLALAQTQIQPSNLQSQRVTELETENRRLKEAQEREEKNAIAEQIRQQQEILNMAIMAQYGVGQPQQTETQAQAQALPTTPEQRDSRIEEIMVSPVNKQGDGIVTTLRRGFYGSGETSARRNTILATVSGKQIVSDGQSVRIRLREPMQVGQMIIPIGTIVVGVANIGVDRVFISINSIQSEGVITPIQMNVYDYDGQHGLFVPGSLENEAFREIASDITTGIGSTTSNNISMFGQQPNAAEQIKADVMRGTIQGTSRYVGRKLSQIKVVLQDNHKLYLVANSTR